VHAGYGMYIAEHLIQKNESLHLLQVFMKKSYEPLGTRYAMSVHDFVYVLVEPVFSSIENNWTRKTSHYHMRHTHPH